MKVKIKELSLGEMQNACDTRQCEDCPLCVQIDGFCTDKVCIKELIFNKETLEDVLNTSVDVIRLPEQK